MSLSSHIVKAIVAEAFPEKQVRIVGHTSNIKGLCWGYFGGYYKTITLPIPEGGELPIFMVRIEENRALVYVPIK